MWSAGQLVYEIENRMPLAAYIFSLTINFKITFSRPDLRWWSSEIFSESNVIANHWSTLWQSVFAAFWSLETKRLRFSFSCLQFRIRIKIYLAWSPGLTKSCLQFVDWQKQFIMTAVLLLDSIKSPDSRRSLLFWSAPEKYAPFVTWCTELTVEH